MAKTIIAGPANTAAPVAYGPDQFRELILDPILASPDLTQIIDIQDGIKGDTDILFAKPFSKVTVIDTGCGTVPNTPGMDVEKLTWKPVPLEAWIQECGPDFEATFMKWGLGVGYKRPDLREAVIKIRNGMGATDVQTLNYWNEFVQDMMERAIRDDIFRIGFFSDPAITAGQLSGGADAVKHFNQMRGIWPQVIALATAYPAVRAYTIDANQSANQLLPDGEASKVFTSLVFGPTIDRRLRGLDFGTPIIQCTQSLADNWALERQSKNLETSFKLVETGLVGPRFNNIEIVPRPEWDEIIARDFTVNGRANLPHRALLSVKENLAFGFDSYDAATQVKSWHNDETKFTHMRGNFKMDAKVMRPFLTRAAF